MWMFDYSRDFDAQNWKFNVFASVLICGMACALQKGHEAAEELKRRYEEANAQNEENNRLLLQRLSASIWIPVAEAPRPSAKDIRRAEREIRKRQEELERQLLYAIRGRVTWGFEASDWNEKRQRSVGGPSRPAGGVKRKLPIDEHAQPPVPTDEDPQTLTAAERMPWNSWATMPDTDDGHGSPEPPAKRICRRLENGDEVIEETVTLPGGYDGIEVEKLIKGPKPELCRKRDNPDYEEDDQDLETLRRVAEGRMVRRRVGKLAEAITTDPEMFVVERFAEIAAKYARYDVLGESTTDRLSIDSTEVTHISDGNADALEREDPSSTLEDEEDTGYFSADKEDNSDNESDEDTSPRFNAQAKGKMPAEGPRAQIAQSSNPATDVKPHENDSANLSSASASRSLRAQANGKIPATSSSKKTSAKNDLTTQAKARIINAVVLAAENRLGLSALAPRVPVQLDEGEWIDENGTRWKVVADGKKYQRVAVKEWRRKYYRPTDSVDPARFAMHRVLVDKWVNSQELWQLEEAGLLGWQDDDHEPSQRIEQDRGDQRPPRQLEEPEELQSVTSGPPAPGQMRLSLQEQWEIFNPPRPQRTPPPFTSTSAATRSTPILPTTVNYRAIAGVGHSVTPRTPALRAYQSARRDMGISSSTSARIRYGRCDRSGYMGY